MKPGSVKWVRSRKGYPQMTQISQRRKITKRSQRVRENHAGFEARGCEMNHENPISVPLSVEVIGNSGVKSERVQSGRDFDRKSAPAGSADARFDGFGRRGFSETGKAFGTRAVRGRSHTNPCVPTSPPRSWCRSQGRTAQRARSTLL